MRARLESYFGVRASGSNLRREVLGGLTTFLTMAYILVVNPVILSVAGMDRDGAFLATALASAFATLLMGVVGRIPIALAPGTGLLEVPGGLLEVSWGPKSAPNRLPLPNPDFGQHRDFEVDFVCIFTG